MLEILGAPRENYSANEQPITNPTLKRRIVTSHVGPISVTGLDSAIASFQSVMAVIQSQQRLICRVLKSDGMLAVRYVRGSTTHISNHSWGTAVDLKIGKQADKQGDNQVLFGLFLLAPIFNAQGWYWGAGFPKEDGMHFEAGQALVRGWKGAP